MSIQASLSSHGLEEVFTPPTLKEICLHKCVTNKEILTTEVKVDEAKNGSKKLAWKKFRLKELIPREVVESLLDAGDKYLLMLTANYEPVLAAIRMSQPDHLVKVHVTNTYTLKDRQLELLLSGGNVKSLDIHGCQSLRCRSLDAINIFGNSLEYLRLGNCIQILPRPEKFRPSSAILRTPNLKTFIVSSLVCPRNYVTDYWRFLLQDFISNLEDLQISCCGNFETLEFLEPAKCKLSSLALSHLYELPTDANAWATLFKLNKLRFLDLVGVDAGVASDFLGENIVQHLLTAMPNLTHLAVYPCPVKDIYVEIDNSIRGQRTVAKQLEFLGMVENDEADLTKAKLLASDVAYFWTIEGELRILEYFSNRRHFYFYIQLERLFKRLSDEKAGTPSSNTGTVISLFLKSFKYYGIRNLDFKMSLPILKPLLSTEIAAKLGDWELGLLLDQFIEASLCTGLRRFTYVAGKYEEVIQKKIMIDVVDMMINLDGELCFDHYVTVVPRLMRMAELLMTNSVLDHIGERGFMGFLKKITELLENAVNRERLSEEAYALWGISSVLVVTKELKDVMVYRCGRCGLKKIFSNLIAVLRRLCLTSGHRRAAFVSAKGVEIVMDLLTDVIDGDLDGFADGESFALLEILKSILQDTKLDLSESGKIASDLEKLLCSVHSDWERSKFSNADKKSTNYLKMERIASLLNCLECDPRFDYKASGAKKAIMVKFK